MGSWKTKRLFDGGKARPKDECLAYIKEVWTDMRPISLRGNREEIERSAIRSRSITRRDTRSCAKRR